MIDDAIHFHLEQMRIAGGGWRAEHNARRRWFVIRLIRIRRLLRQRAA